jgi:hypothetical protein
MAKPLIRDFIYLDIERIRSFVAQASGGLASERTDQAQHQVGGEGKAEGGLPFIAKASGAANYHYLRSQSETKSLHDHIFAEFYSSLKAGDHIEDFSDPDETYWVESSFQDSTFILTRGLLKIVDYQSIIASTQNLPTLMETILRLSTLAPDTNSQQTPSVSATKGSSKNSKGNASQSEQEKELQKIKAQIRNLPLKDFTTLVNQFYGELVRIKVFPLQSSPEKLFVGAADRALFRYTPSALMNLYGSVIDAGWVYVLQINKGTFHEPGLLLSQTGNTMEDGLEQVADIFSGLARMTQGVEFPAVAVTPIAIYREL